jgi:hypothetical protein
VLTLSKLSETATTVVLGWSPPAGVGGYVFYANGQVSSVASRNNKDGSPRNTVKFSKTNPGPPFQVAAVCRSSNGAFSMEVGTYQGGTTLAIYPSNTLYPSETSP